jgi:hypothetical protein
MIILNDCISFEFLIWILINEWNVLVQVLEVNFNDENDAEPGKVMGVWDGTY